MTKTIKTLLITSIIIFFTVCPVQAINMNLTDTSNTNTNSTNHGNNTASTRNK